MIYILGDLHKRKESPYREAADLVLKELYSKVTNGDSIIQLGDFFHSYKPFPAEYTEALSWLNKLGSKGVKIYIMAGNNAHEYHHIQKTYAITPLESLDCVKTITDLSILEVDGIKFFAIPWIPNEKLKKNGCETVEDYIKKFLDSTDEKAQYLLYHYEDETVFMGGENHGIDFSFVEKAMPDIVRIGGHIHLQSTNYIGTPYQTRFDEAGQTGRYYVIDSDNSLEVKKFKMYVKHMNIHFEDEVPTPDFKEQKIILNIDEVPAIEAAYDKFTKNYIFINNLKLKFSEDRQLLASEELDAKSSVRELLQEYIKINNVDKETSDYLYSLF